MKKGVLFIDITKKGCWDCFCCGEEYGCCEALRDRYDIDTKCSRRAYVEPNNRLPECPIKEITITPEVFAERMREIYREEVDERNDGEVAKLEMLKLMYEILCNFGYEEGVDIFRKTPWY